MSIDDLNAFIEPPARKRLAPPTDYVVGSGDYSHVTWSARRHCEGRGHPRRGLGVLIQRNEVRQIVDHCLDCGKKVSTVKRPAAIDIDSLPLYRDNRAPCGPWHREEPCRIVLSDGRERVTMGCLRCGRETVNPVPRDLSVPRDTLPVLSDARFDEEGHLVVAPCEHCHTRTGTQLHHLAPQALFPDADRWPVAYLCPPCHALWHRLVTPHLARRAS